MGGELDSSRRTQEAPGATQATGVPLTPARTVQALHGAVSVFYGGTGRYPGGTWASWAVAWATGRAHGLCSVVLSSTCSSWVFARRLNRPVIALVSKMAIAGADSPGWSGPGSIDLVRSQLNNVPSGVTNTGRNAGLASPIMPSLTLRTEKITPVIPSRTGWTSMRIRC